MKTNKKHRFNKYSKVKKTVGRFEIDKNHWKYHIRVEHEKYVSKHKHEFLGND